MTKPKFDLKSHHKRIIDKYHGSRAKETTTLKDMVFEIANKHDITFTQEQLLFLYGVKPALLVSNFDHRDKAVNIIAEVYPSVGLPLRRNNTRLLFQDHSVFMDFVNNVSAKIEPRSFNFHSFVDYDNVELGRILGYPPLATKWYKETNREKNLGQEEHWKVTAFIDYHGLKFGCYKEEVFECILWLNENRKVPKEIQTEVFYRIKDNEGTAQTVRVF